MALPILTEHIERNILLIRGHRVMLDTDLAILYGVPTKRLNEQVRRNKKRFPSDFMFQLKPKEVERLRSQIATLSQVAGNTENTTPTHSPSKAWPCSQACCMASPLSK
jgi:hypothetical protein